MKTHKLFDVVEELELIKKENYDVQSIIIDLKEKVATNVKTVLNLKEEVNANDMTISSLQSMIKVSRRIVYKKKLVVIFNLLLLKNIYINVGRL